VTYETVQVELTASVVRTALYCQTQADNSQTRPGATYAESRLKLQLPGTKGVLQPATMGMQQEVAICEAPQPSHGSVPHAPKPSVAQPGEQMPPKP